MEGSDDNPSQIDIGSQVSHYVSLQGLFANQDQGSLTLDEYKIYRDTQFKDTGMNLMQQLRCIIDKNFFNRIEMELKHAEKTNDFSGVEGYHGELYEASMALFRLMAFGPEADPTSHTPTWLKKRFPPRDGEDKDGKNCNSGYVFCEALLSQIKNAKKAFEGRCKSSLALLKKHMEGRIVELPPSPSLSLCNNNPTGLLDRTPAEKRSLGDNRLVNIAAGSGSAFKRIRRGESTTPTPPPPPPPPPCLTATTLLFSPAANDRLPISGRGEDADTKGVEEGRVSEEEGDGKDGEEGDATELTSRSSQEMELEERKEGNPDNGGDYDATRPKPPQQSPPPPCSTVTTLSFSPAATARLPISERREDTDMKGAEEGTVSEEEGDGKDGEEGDTTEQLFTSRASEKMEFEEGEKEDPDNGGDDAPTQGTEGTVGTEWIESTDSISPTPVTQGNPPTVVQQWVIVEDGDNPTVIRGRDSLVPSRTIESGSVVSIVKQANGLLATDCNGDQYTLLFEWISRDYALPVRFQQQNGLSENSAPSSEDIKDGRRDCKAISTNNPGTERSGPSVNTSSSSVSEASPPIGAPSVTETVAPVHSKSSESTKSSSSGGTFLVDKDYKKDEMEHKSSSAVSKAQPPTVALNNASATPASEFAVTFPKGRDTGADVMMDASGPLPSNATPVGGKEPSPQFQPMGSTFLNPPKEGVSNSPPSPVAIKPAITDHLAIITQELLQYDGSSIFRDKDGGIYRIIKEKPDGNCLFRAISRFVYKDPKQHPVARREICNEMQQRRNDGIMEESQFTSETNEEASVILPAGLSSNFTASTLHISLMRANREYGSDHEVCASISRYQIQVQVVDKISGSVRLMDSSQAKDAKTLYVLFGHCHYDTLQKLDLVDQDLFHLSQSLSKVGLNLNPQLKVVDRMVDRDAINAFFSFPFEDRVKLLEIFTEGKPDDIVVMNPQILRKDIRTLRNGVWVNDEIINMCGVLIQDLVDNPSIPNKKQVCVLPSYFWAKLTEGNIYNFKNVKKWITKRGLDIVTLDMLIIPINQRNTHWSCVFIHMKEQQMFALDSSPSVNEKDTYFGHLLRFLQDAFKERGQSFDGDAWKWEPYTKEAIPLQRNNFDCGLFTIRYMFNIALGRALEFRQEGMAWFRFYIALRMLMIKPTLQYK